MKTNKHLYDHVLYDSDKEQAFAAELGLMDKVMK